MRIVRCLPFIALTTFIIAAHGPNPTVDFVEVKICELLQDKNIKDKDKIYKVVELSLQQSGRFQRYGKELLGTPRWYKFIELMTDKSLWTTLNKIPNNYYCSNTSLAYLARWHESNQSAKFVDLLMKLGYIDKECFFKRRVTKVPESDCKVILEWLKVQLDTIYT